MKPIRKFNSGMGALLCNTCTTIIVTGKDAWEGNRLICDKCELKCLMKGFLQDATQEEVPKILLLDRVMDSIEKYVKKKLIQ